MRPSKTPNERNETAAEFPHDFASSLRSFASLRFTFFTRCATFVRTQNHSSPFSSFNSFNSFNLTRLRSRSSAFYAFFRGRNRSLSVSLKSVSAYTYNAVQPQHSEPLPVEPIRAVKTRKRPFQSRSACVRGGPASSFRSAHP